MDQVRIAQQRLAEQVDVAERRAYEARGPGWVFPKIGVYNPPNHPLNIGFSIIMFIQGTPKSSIKK